ncbi:hypothetical protein M407DRAFT_27991 [Tulasnella calospora MUT 4182]|uniref:Methyltransferase domain-containing protein n=1 Tax=Tulasnella calospora MUT 4182 TaxID=1051891 RepID=A0A0C3Q274_9AGAM|nr:hypothetical protein M407DRAFT_27991 [Tulasnella calospora MUT 4182]
MSQPSTSETRTVPTRVGTKHTNIDPRSDVQIANGRTFSKQAGALYTLPTDAKEHNRLDYQHEMIRLLLDDSICPNPDLVNKTLSADANPTPNIIDIGTGSGVWAIEMARKFPHANVLGCDIVLPEHPGESVPSNCRFEFLNLNKDMEKIKDMFDVVHWQLVEPATFDSDQFFYDVARILRPGGVFIAVAANPRLLDETGTVIPLKRAGDPKYSHFQHLMKGAYDYQFAEGPPRMIHGLWNQVFGSNPNFKDFRMQEFLIPTGPWEEEMTDKRRKIAEIMNENIRHVVPSIAAGLRVHSKLPPDEINRLEEGSLKEFRELPPSAHAYSKWVFATTVRTDSAWSARTQRWKAPEWFGPADHIIPPLSEDS